MANFVYDLVDLGELTDYARAYNNEILRTEFALQELFPDRLVEDLDYRIQKASFIDVDAAEYRAFDTPNRMTQRQGTAQIKGSLPPLGRQIAMGEEELLRLRDMLRGDQSTVINQIYNDVERMVRAVQVRLEMARGQLLSTGKVTLAENGVAMEADFNVPAGNITTAALAWSNPASLILSELLAKQQAYIDATGVAPGGMVLSKTVESYMLLNSEMRSAAAFGGVTPGRLNRETVRNILDAHGLPSYMLYDTQVRVNGVQARVFPADKIAFIPPAGEKLGETFYGITAEAIKLAGKGIIKAQAMPGIVATVVESDHPVATFTNAAALAMPVLGNSELLATLDVIP